MRHRALAAHAAVQCEHKTAYAHQVQGRPAQSRWHVNLVQKVLHKRVAVAAEQRVHLIIVFLCCAAQRMVPRCSLVTARVEAAGRAWCKRNVPRGLAKCKVATADTKPREVICDPLGRGDACRQRASASVSCALHPELCGKGTLDETTGKHYRLKQSPSLRAELFQTLWLSVLRDRCFHSGKVHMLHDISLLDDSVLTMQRQACRCAVLCEVRDAGCDWHTNSATVPLHCWECDACFVPDYQRAASSERTNVSNGRRNACEERYWRPHNAVCRRIVGSLAHVRNGAQLS